MRNVLSTVLALVATTMIFLTVTIKQSFRRWFGLKSLFFSYINEAQHVNTFHIPENIQRRFKRIMFWRTMFKRPFIFEKSAQKIHADMLSFIKLKNWNPSESRKLDIIEWDE